MDLTRLERFKVHQYIGKYVDYNTHQIDVTLKMIAQCPPRHLTHSDIKRALRCVNSQTTCLFVQQLVQANDKETIKVSYLWPFEWGIY